LPWVKTAEAARDGWSGRLTPLKRWVVRSGLGPGI